MEFPSLEKIGRKCIEILKFSVLQLKGREGERGPKKQGFFSRDCRKFSISGFYENPKIEILLQLTHLCIYYLLFNFDKFPHLLLFTITFHLLLFIKLTFAQIIKKSQNNLTIFKNFFFFHLNTQNFQRSFIPLSHPDKINASNFALIESFYKVLQIFPNKLKI